MQAAMLNDKLPVYLPGILWQICRPVGLTDARTEAQAMKLSELVVDPAAHAAVPMNGKCPMGQADVEAVEIHCSSLHQFTGPSLASIDQAMQHLFDAVSLACE